MSTHPTVSSPLRSPQGDTPPSSSVLLLLGSLLTALAAPTGAQTVPTGFQEYFVLGRTEHVHDMMDEVEALEGGGPFAAEMRELITATASADNQVIYYDHWEDGFEADVFSPVQLSSMILGDGNPANGDACDFNANLTCGVDILNRGDFVNLASDQGAGAGCTIPSISPGIYTELCSSVPVNTRCAVLGACTNGEVHFDGGDLLVSTGGPLALIHSQDPDDQFIGGSTEVISRQAVEAARSYTIPVGEDLFIDFGCPNCVMEPFQVVELDLVAFEDATLVTVDSPGSATIPPQVVSFTLNRGEHWNSLGFIDEQPVDPTIQLTITTGTVVRTSAPITGMVFTGGDGVWATRHYTLLPDILHSTDYVLTAPGDDPTLPVGGTTNRPLNIYILNPDPLNAIAVTTTDSVGTSVINIGPGTMVDYFTGTGRFVPVDSTVRLTSDRNFWGISGYDHDTNVSDWGHSWLATRFLTPEYTVSFAPGDDGRIAPPENLNAVYVAATQDRTRVQADFNNDGVFDTIDVDGDGVADPSADVPGDPTIYIIDALEALVIFDPAELDLGIPGCDPTEDTDGDLDCDATGTRILANKPVAVAYGQETDLTDFGDDGKDTGFTIYPVDQLFLDPVLTLEKTVDSPVVPTAGGIATYTLRINTFDSPINSLLAYDLLPPGITGTDYVPGSTLIIYPNLTQDTTDPVASIDPGTGRDRLDWTLSPNSMGPNQELTITYSIAIPAAPGGTPRQLVNEAHVEGQLGGSVFAPVDTAEVVQTSITLAKTVDLGSPEAGDVLTFTIQVTNSGPLTENNTFVSDAIPANTTFVPGSVTSSGPFTGAFDAVQNSVEWSAPTFLPGGPHALSFQARVNPGVPAGTEIPNRAGYDSAETLFFLSNEAIPQVVGPELIVSKTGPALLHPNEVTTFEISVENVGAAAADNLRIVDFFPANATYVSESMSYRLNIDPFATVTDAADADPGIEFVDRLELLIPSLGAGQDLDFRFQVRVDPGTAGLFVANQATVTSDEVLPTNTNLVQAPIVGDADVTGHVFLDLDGNGVQDPGEPDLANIDVIVTDSTGNQQIVTTDANGDWTATAALACYEDAFAAVAYNGSDGSLDWSGAGDEWIEFSTNAGLVDQDPTTIPLLAETDPLGVFGNSLLIEGGPAAADRGFTRQADLSAAAGFTQGFASLSFDFRRVSMEATDSVQLDIDYDNDGTFNDVLGAFPGIGTDAIWQSASFALDSAQLPDNPVVFRFLGTNFNFGNDNFYVDNVRLCNTQVTADVDETDPDFPIGATLTTANDPQTVEAVIGGTVATGDVGYETPPLTFAKVSDAVNNEVSPGQIVTYTLQLTNNTAVTQTGIDINDPQPPGTLSVPGSTQVTVAAPVLRVTEYFIDAAPAVPSFPGTMFDLTLNQALATDYFVILQGSDGDTSPNNGRGPDENYAALTQDPFGTGQLGVSAGANVIRLERGATVDDWVGVVTVVECLNDCTGHGFSLVDVRRVDHLGAGTAGAVTTGAPWTDINQVMLMGGFNGAGCNTSEPDVADTKVCHARIFPSGVDQVNWTRDAGGATLSDATSTVMAVEWGTAWTVQRVRVQGGNGGDGADAVGEYNTAAISPVARAGTWVWGSGHTNDQGIGDAAEAVLLTLGDGVNQNATESLVAAGIEVAGNAVDFEVYALTHPDLNVDDQFKVDGDTGVLTFDVAVASALSNRMALAYNGQNGTGNAYPRPMFSARYLDDTTVRLERRRSGQPFPAWVQGIDFSTIVNASTVPGNDPAGLVVPADGFTLDPGQTLTVTFQVQVDPNLALAVTQIINNAMADTDDPLTGPFNATVTDNVIRLGVRVEPNNADFATPGSTVLYNHEVRNTGDQPDAYDITVMSEQGWVVELIDPGTGSVIATDSDGDGVWDGGVMVNTGTLGVDETIEYQVRVTVPGGTPVGTEESTTLLARSDRNPQLSDFATDETIVIDPADVGEVILLPDNSGIVAAGGSVVYTHNIINNSGATDTFDLTASSSLPGWTTRIFNDSNGDGVFTPGVDLEIANTRQLTDGERQTFFVEVTAPPGAMLGDTHVADILAISRTDPAIVDLATDTTTVAPPQSHDLSGGGTLSILPGNTGVYPGTIKNQSDSTDTYDFTLGPALLFGTDALNHTTQLWVDTDADGIPDTQIAEDTDGDGRWDTVAAGFDTDSDGNPDVTVAADAELAYELRRPIDPAQGPSRDSVTLSATSQTNGEVDSVTAANLLLLATHAFLAEFEASTRGDGGVVVEWQTALEAGTAGFHVERAVDGRDFVRVTQQPLPGLLLAPQGGSYQFVDRAAPAGDLIYRLVEVDVHGAERAYAPREVTHGGVRQVSEAYSREANRSRRRPSPAEAGATAAKVAKATVPPERVRVPTEGSGLVFVATTDLAATFQVSLDTVEAAIGEGRLRVIRDPFAPVEAPAPGECPEPVPGPDEIFRDGFESGDACLWSLAVPEIIPEPPLPGGPGVAWLGAADASGLYFFAEAIDSIYTDHNVYWIDFHPGVTLRTTDRPILRPASSVAFTETLNVEEDAFPATAVGDDPDGDFWFWDFFLAGDPVQGIKSFPVTVPGAVSTTGARLRVRLHAQTEVRDVDDEHRVLVRFNGTALGKRHWDGDQEVVLELDLAPGVLQDGANTLELEFLLAAGVAFDVVYLDGVELVYSRAYRAESDVLLAPAGGAETLRFAGFSRDDVEVFDVSNPERPRRLGSTLVEFDGDAYSVTFAANPLARYLALPLDLAQRGLPEGDEPSDLRSPSNRGEYVVIAGPGLEDAAQSLVSYRAEQGLEGVLARVQDVYDEWNGGVADPFAIRRFLAHARSEWSLAPRWVVLAGDSSFDYKDVLGLGENLVPAPMVATRDGLFVSDNRLADLEGDDGVPDGVALGRLPVHSGAELDAYLVKLVTHEEAAGGWKDRAVWVADDPDDGGDFEVDSESLLALLPAPFQNERIFLEPLGEAAARDATLASFVDGARLVNFMGHGGLDRLADEGVVLTSDVAALVNGGRAPILTALTCAVGRYDLPGFDTLSETLIVQADGGAVAVWSPSALSWNSEALEVGASFLAAGFGQGRRLGDAINAALADYVTGENIDRKLPFVFILLGDPAISLAR